MSDDWSAKKNWNEKTTLMLMYSGIEREKKWYIFCKPKIKLVCRLSGNYLRAVMNSQIIEVLFQFNIFSVRCTFTDNQNNFHVDCSWMETQLWVSLTVIILFFVGANSHKIKMQTKNATLKTLQRFNLINFKLIVSAVCRWQFYLLKMAKQFHFISMHNKLQKPGVLHNQT